jgi:predicted alpha/beta superfamily hydrolase
MSDQGASPAFPADKWWMAKSAQGPRAEVAIADTRRIDFTSSVNGRRYSISIALPWAPPPPNGYSALYVLESYAYFATATEATRLNVLFPGVVVVGIGYPNDPAYVDATIERRQPVPPWMLMGPRSIAAWSLERQYDLTLPASEAALSAWSAPGVLTYSTDETGGLDDFLRTIEADVKPQVRQIAPIDETNTALFGHSLGGLAVVRSLFENPGGFRSYIASSPSLTWANDAVLAGEASFAAKVASGAASPRLLVTLGADEAAATTNLPEELGQTNAEQMALGARTVSAIRDLPERLRKLKGGDGYEVADLAVFAHQGHGVAPWPAIGRAVSFAFQ